MIYFNSNLGPRTPSKIPALHVFLLLPRRIQLICSMETCSRAAIMSSICSVLSIEPEDLWSLVLGVLPKLLGVPPILLKKFWIKEHVHPPIMDSEDARATLPVLPQDMLMAIFASLEIPDLVRAGCVCSTWHSAYTSLRDTGKYKQSQTPCLLYTSESAGENVAFLYSLVENRPYKFTLPDPPIRSRFLIGSSLGWLVTADEQSELHLVNPITGEQMALPSVTTIEHVKPISDESGALCNYELSYHTGQKVHKSPKIYALNDLREHLYFKAFVFPDPPSESYIAVIIHHPYYQLSFARAGDNKWTWLPPNFRYRDCLYMGRMLYALTSLGEIDAFDLSASSITMKVIIDELKQSIYESMYIIQAPWGDLLQIWRTVDVPGQEFDNGDVPWQGFDNGDVPEPDPSMPLVCTLKVIAYKVDMEAKKLVKINSLPYHMLFLGHSNSLCLSVQEHPQLKANHAYYTDDLDELTMSTKNNARDIGVLDMESRRRKEIVSQIWSSWPSPTWITPSLRKTDLSFSK